MSDEELLNRGLPKVPQMIVTRASVSSIRVDPSDALNPIYARPSWATHVCWYNK